MSRDGKNSNLEDVLKGIEKELKTIRRTLSTFEGRIGALENAVEQKFPPTGENPLIYSRVLMATVNTINEYENEHGQGVVAKDLARLRGLEVPTIYDHLSKLEEANLIFWQRGSELGLKPFNAKFYSVAARDEHLEDIPVLMSLPDFVVPIAQAILKKGKAGTARKSLLENVKSLHERGEEPWSKVPPNEIEEHLDEALRRLLRKVLIRQEKKLEETLYYPRAD
jgi:hypothetical protein